VVWLKRNGDLLPHQSTAVFFVTKMRKGRLGSIWTSMSQSLTSFTSRFSRFGGLVAVLVFFLYGTFSSYHYFLVRQQTSNTEVNTFCQDNLKTVC
jgi:hypothetical protein